MQASFRKRATNFRMQAFASCIKRLQRWLVMPKNKIQKNWKSHGHFIFLCSNSMEFGLHAALGAFWRHWLQSWLQSCSYFIFHLPLEKLTFFFHFFFPLLFPLVSYAHWIARCPWCSLMPNITKLKDHKAESGLFSFVFFLFSFSFFIFFSP